MSVIVTGCGRSGTNLVLEILRGNSYLKATDLIEDKFFARRGYFKYSIDYLSKCDVLYFTVEQFRKTLLANQDMKVVWCIRDPRDMILSKLKRGQLIKDGGDSLTGSEDGMFNKCHLSIRAAFDKHLALMKDEDLNNCILVVKMEDTILNPEASAKRMCLFLDIPYQSSMLDIKMRNKFKKARYKGIDKSQVGLWKHWDTVYDGFFKKQSYNVLETFDRVKDIMAAYGYDY